MKVLPITAPSSPCAAIATQDSDREGIQLRSFVAATVLLMALALLAAGQLEAQPRILTDNFGYLPDAAKRALVSADPGSEVEVRNLAGSTIWRIPADGGSITALGRDSFASGDDLWEVDFGSFTTPGSYRLYSSALADASYAFEIADDVYAASARASLRTFYYQRCGEQKSAAYAGVWSDGDACHLGDTRTRRANGQADRGALDLSGGWHDAGDYNKYVWRATSDALWSLLSTYLDRPEAFGDGDLGIPESGNGVPDLLDEVRVELDWLLKMQQGDGSVLSQVRQSSFEFRSPPSTDAETRFYSDPNLDSGSVLAGSMALGARAFKDVDAGYSARLKAAAEASWSWLAQQGDSDLKVWAAAELFRLDPSNSSARAYVDGFTDWSQQWFEMDTTEWRAAIAYVRTPGATSATVAGMRQRIDFHVDNVLSLGGPWRAGMQNWQYYWGSNRPRALYGLFLLQAAKTGSTGSSNPEAMRERALDYLHFLHGRNALGMLYLTNMSTLGGEHSSYQIFHGWFGNWSDRDSIARFIGKPAQVVEPDYPYYKGRDNHGVRDNKVVTLGPPPGFVPGGPNASYGANGDESAPPANATYVDRAYRDWADQTVWTARTWEVTENSISYQGPYTALAYHFVPATATARPFRPTPAFLPQRLSVCLAGVLP